MSNIKIYNQDCMEMLKNIPDNSIDLIITDPPYDVSCTGGGGSQGHKIATMGEDLVDLNINEGYDIRTVGKEIIRVMKKINVYFWCNKKQIPEYFDFYVKENDCKFDILTWNKTNPVPTYSNKYLSDTEYCLYFRNGGYCNPANWEDGKTYWYEPINNADKKVWEHPTIKPQHMIEKLIRNSSKQGQLVMDLYLGSGTTAAACKKLNRNFIGSEINEKYYKIALDRVENQQQELEEDKNVLEGFFE
jgi:site-specific DNA-methyltransferase (adenine-specific)